MSQFKEISIEQYSCNPFQMIGESWMLITAEKDGQVNTMTASWGGLGHMWSKNVAFIVIRPQRYTKEFVDAADTFSLCFFDDHYKKTLAYLGGVSGRIEDKILKSGLTVSHYNDTPIFEEANSILLCKKLFNQSFNKNSFIDTRIPTTSYVNDDYHVLYISEITTVLSK